MTEINDENEEGEVDLFEELGVEAPSPNAPESDPLEAFLDEEEDGEEIDELRTEIIEIGVEEEVDDDDDPFVALGVAGPTVTLAASDAEHDPLAALMDDDDEDEGEDNPIIESTEKTSMDSIAAYRMVLETVWVDGLLDPGEVSLLAGRRKELGISFEEHLALVRDMLG